MILVQIKNKYKQKEILELFRQNKLIPIMTLYYLMALLFNPQESLKLFPLIVFTIVILGLISLLIKSYKILKS